MEIRQRSLSRKTGVEGPGNDPYGYGEFILTVNGKNKVVLHKGLAEYLEVDGERIEFPSPEQIEAAFGMSESWIERAYWRINRLPKVCPECGCSKFGEVAGYPGEMFTVCQKCGKILDYTFHESAVM